MEEKKYKGGKSCGASWGQFIAAPSITTTTAVKTTAAERKRSNSTNDECREEILHGDSGWPEEGKEREER